MAGQSPDAQEGGRRENTSSGRTAIVPGDSDENGPAVFCCCRAPATPSSKVRTVYPLVVYRRRLTRASGV